MITRQEERDARTWAWQAARRAGLVLRDEEIERIEVADFGLSRLRQIGAQILTLEANPWVAVKVLILMPWQLEPQHRHPPCEAEHLLQTVDPSLFARQVAHHYGLLWWNNADGTLAGVPRDAYWSHGLGDSLIIVMPSLDLVAARAGKAWKRREGAEHYDVLKPFLGPLATSVRAHAGNPAVP